MGEKKKKGENKTQFKSEQEDETRQGNSHNIKYSSTFQRKEQKLNEPHSKYGVIPP